MPGDENIPPSDSRRQREPDDALQLGPRKKLCIPDPLVHYGRHFGRTVHAFCNVRILLTNGLLRMDSSTDEPETSSTCESSREQLIFTRLLQMIPGIKERLLEASNKDVAMIADKIQKGSSNARSDDAKSLKGPILDWIAEKDEPLNPPLARNSKIGRGFHRERTGALLCPAGLDWSIAEVKEQLSSGKIIVPGNQWPIFLYAGCVYDTEELWKGLLRSTILVSAYKHVFTSPSSVGKEAKATRSGNARIHGMTCVTQASLVYIATQVRFTLSSSSVFSRTDSTMDSEQFFTSLLGLLDDIDERQEVEDLLAWWNRQIFPNSSVARAPVAKNSALAKIKEKQALRKANVHVVG